VRVFFGPAGEGKTTTIAKLAGEAVVRRGRRAAVISADTYRVGGTHELAAYGRVLGVPFAAVADGAELARAVKSFAGVEEILVDTGGITAGDPQQLAEVAALCEALGGSAAGDGVGRTLVVSATAAPAVARRVWHALRALHPDSCIVTKVDEAAAVGVLEVLWRQRLPLTFFGTGRRVPHDLERASPERVAAGLVAA
jgi:flagellar biosynthesis protein FlhF